MTNDFGWCLVTGTAAKRWSAWSLVLLCLMQESGVSKRVSVRFDDVTDDGHIRREALDRAAHEEPKENAA